MQKTQTEKRAGNASYEIVELPVGTYSPATVEFTTLLNGCVPFWLEPKPSTIPHGMIPDEHRIKTRESRDYFNQVLNGFREQPFEEQQRILTETFNEIPPHELQYVIPASARKDWKKERNYQSESPEHPDAPWNNVARVLEGSREIRAASLRLFLRAPDTNRLVDTTGGNSHPRRPDR